MQPPLAAAKRSWPFPLTPLSDNYFLGGDPAGSLILVYDSLLDLPKGQIKQLLKFAYAVAVIRPECVQIWREDSLTQFPVRSPSLAPSLLASLIEAPPVLAASARDCEKAVLALHVFASRCEVEHHFDLLDVLEFLLTPPSPEGEITSPLLTNACCWLMRWQKVLGYCDRPAAWVSHIYSRLAPVLERTDQRKRAAWFTPKVVADFLAAAAFELLDQLPLKPCVVLEPAAGVGNLAEALLHAAADRQIDVSLSAVESHAPSARIGRLALSSRVNTQVLHEDWLADRSQVDRWLDQNQSAVQTGYLLVVANPPWSGISNHMSSWIQELISDYRFIEGMSIAERKHWLSDEYVKFLRLTQYLFERSEAEGAVALVCSHSWLDNPTFRGLRHKILEQFDQVHIIDLHGSKLKCEAVPPGVVDENLFGIRQGVCLLIAGKSQRLPKQVKWAECWGTVEQKTEQLRQFDFRNGPWTSLFPAGPDWLLVPRAAVSSRRKLLCTSITKLFQVYGSGIVTARDAFALADRPDELIDRIQTLRSEDYTDVELAHRWGLRPTTSFDLARSREQLRLIPELELPTWVRPILYRPFWWRYVFYHDAVVERRVYRLMQHQERPNMALVTVRRSAAGHPAGYYLAASGLVSQGCIRADNQSIDYVFPLWRYDWPDGLYDRFANPVRVSNLNTEALLAPEQLYGRRLAPHEVFGYLYALAWSSNYRKVFQSDLKANFMQLAWVLEEQIFTRLSALGWELALLHTNPIELLPLLDCDIHSNNRINAFDIHDNLSSLNSSILKLQIGSYRVVSYWIKRLKKTAGIDPTSLHQAFEHLIDRLDSTVAIQSQIDDLVPESYWV